MKSRLPVVPLILVLGTLVMSACAPIQGERINPVEQASLRGTVKIEVMEFDPDTPSCHWAPGLACRRHTSCNST
jgi:hypothetical protein